MEHRGKSRPWRKTSTDILTLRVFFQGRHQSPLGITGSLLFTPMVAPQVQVTGVRHSPVDTPTLLVLSKIPLSPDPDVGLRVSF